MPRPKPFGRFGDGLIALRTFYATCLLCVLRGDERERRISLLVVPEVTCPKGKYFTLHTLAHPQRMVGGNTFLDAFGRTLP